MKPTEDHFLLGAACAVIAGSIVVFIDGFEGIQREFLGEPAFVGLGITVAAVGGGTLARRVVDVPRIYAIGFAILLGVTAPMVAGAIVFPPLFFVGAFVGLEMWPATIPAGFIWMVAVRSLARYPAKPDRVVRAGTALGLAFALFAIRYTQPAWVESSDGTRCLSFPNEYIGAIAWSPDGAWLGIGSSLDHAEGVVRLLDRRSGQIVELARGSQLDAEFSGIAVGPRGATVYAERHGDIPGVSDDGASIWLSAPGAQPRRYADLPTPAISDLMYTTDGIAGVLWADPDTAEVDIDKLVWIDEGATPGDRLREIRPEEVIRHPVLAPLLRPQGGSINIATPSGNREVRLPSEVSGVTVSRNGREILFVATIPTGEEWQDEVVAISTESGQRRVLAVREAADDPVLAGGWFAYRTTLSSTNTVCIKPVELVD